MNCDQVFMVLTSGPFPTGRTSDVEVELHLEHCPGCWRIAEALRPAHDVFEESVPPDEGRDLPGYWGDAIPARATITQVQQTALRATLVQPAAGHSRLICSVPRRSRDVVGWGEALRIAAFLTLVGTAAFTVVRLWQ